MDELFARLWYANSSREGLDGKAVMDTELVPSPKVWDNEHREYVREHIGKGIEHADDIANALAMYMATGMACYWAEALSLTRSLTEKMVHGSLNRVRATAYYVCDICDSDICEHADRYNDYYTYTA